MFGSGKVTDLPQERSSKIRRGPAFYAVAAMTAALEGMLAVNAAFVANHFVPFVAADLLSWLPGAIIARVASTISGLFGLALGVFGFVVMSNFLPWHERMNGYYKKYIQREHSQRWNWPVWLLYFIVGCVAALDYATLGYRSLFFPAQGGIWIAVFCGIGTPLVWVLGMFAYVLENTPREVMVSQLKRKGARIENQDLEDAFNKMPPALRTRYLEGDPTALDTYWSMVEETREKAHEYEMKQIAARQQEEMERNKDFIQAS